MKRLAFSLMLLFLIIEIATASNCTDLIVALHKNENNNAIENIAISIHEGKVRGTHFKKGSIDIYALDGKAPSEFNEELQDLEAQARNDGYITDFPNQLKLKAEAAIICISTFCMLLSKDPVTVMLSATTIVISAGSLVEKKLASDAVAFKVFADTVTKLSENDTEIDIVVGYNGALHWNKVIYYLEGQGFEEVKN